MSCDFNNSRYFKHSCVNAAKKCFLLALIFNLQNKKSKYDDNDPDNKLKAPLTLSKLLCLMCFCIRVSKFIVISERSPTILETHNTKLVNLIFLFKGKITSYIFGFIAVLLTKHLKLRSFMNLLLRWPFGQENVCR